VSAQIDDLGPDVPRRVLLCGCLVRGGKVASKREACGVHTIGQEIPDDTADETPPEDT
jgi:hypothetical protein